jgi:hypothetical protein
MDSHELIIKLYDGIEWRVLYTVLTRFVPIQRNVAV